MASMNTLPFNAIISGMGAGSVIVSELGFVDVLASDH